MAFLLLKLATNEKAYGVGCSTKFAATLMRVTKLQITRAMDIDKLLDGHVIVKMTNSGKDWGMNKAGKFSKQQGVSRAWIKKNIGDHDYKELMNGETIGITVRRGRGFSYVEYKRVPSEGDKANAGESNCTIRSVVGQSEQLPDDLCHDPILDGDDPHALGLRP